MTARDEAGAAAEEPAPVLDAGVAAAYAAFERHAAPLRAALLQPSQTAVATLVQALSAAMSPWLSELQTRPPSDALAADRRFDDPAWQSHPGYRALGEAYLACGRGLHETIDALRLPGRAPEQWHAAVDQLLDALAPTNVLAGNPAALRRAFDTGGASLAAGMLNWLHDLAHNQGMPSTVDPAGFEVGRNLAATPGRVVLRHEMFELIRYDTRSEGAVNATPLLYVPPQINRFYMIDLAPGRSFVEWAVAQGQQPYVMSWRNPGPEHRDWGLDDYVGAIVEAVEAVCAQAGSPALHLAGSCTGGIAASCAAALLRRRGSARLATLTLMVTMIDTGVPTAFNLHASPSALAATKALVGARGFVDGADLAQVFAWMRPNEMVWNHWVHNVLLGRKPPSFDMLVWNKDTTRLPARLHADLLELGTQNFLLKPGARTLLSEPLDLSAIDVPLYAIGGLSDHIAPWASCYAATQAMRGEATFVLGNGGHIQSIIVPPGSRKAGYYLRDGAPPAQAEAWLASATLHEGSWWPHWNDWLAARSPQAPAGAAPRRRRALADLGPAPGTYVFGR